MSTTSESLTDTLNRLKEEPEKGAEQFEQSVDLDALKVDLSDHTEEELLTSRSDRDLGVEVPDLPETRPVPTHNPPLHEDPAATLQTEIEQRFSGVTPLGVVTVDADERGRFLRAALNDEPMWFDVVIEGMGFTARIYIPSERFITDTPSAVREWAKAGVVDDSSDMQWYLAFQQIHAWYQVRRINHSPTPWSIFFDEPFTQADLRRFIADPAHFDEIINMSAVRWKVIVLALRIAEKKYHLCTEALRDRTFFTGAGTD